VRTLSRKGDLVLDPFCGSGQTLLATKGCGRRYLGIERVQKYVSASQWVGFDELKRSDFELRRLSVSLVGLRKNIRTWGDGTVFLRRHPKLLQTA